MSFDGPELFSYRTALGCKVDHPALGSLFFINRTSYSSSTSKHFIHMRRAIGFDAGNVITVTDDAPRGWRFYNKSLRDLAHMAVEYRIAKARESAVDYSKPRIRQATKDRLVEECRQHLDEAGSIVRKFAAYVPTVSAVVIPDVDALLDLSAQKRQEMEERRKQERQEQERREAARKAEREERERDILASLDAVLVAWQDGSGEIFKIGETIQYAPTFLRVASDTLNLHWFRVAGDEVESSTGARVTFDEMERAIRFALHMKDKVPVTFPTGNEPGVGNYRFRSITADHVQVGCHRVTWQEVERLKGVMDAIKADASETVQG